MKYEGLFDEATAAALRFEWLLAEVEPVSDYGRGLFLAIEPFLPGDAIAAAKRATQIAALAANLSEGTLDAVRDALRSTPDCSAAIARAGMGDVLTDVDFLELQRFCDSVARIHTLIKGHTAFALPRCEPVNRVLERGRSGKFGFFLDDRFDRGLADARTNLRNAHEDYDRARAALAARVAQTLGLQDVASGEFIIMREDLKGTIPPGVHVVREAPTYYLCELELDEAALFALRAEQEAAARVALREEEVRTHLSGVIRANNAELEEACAALGRIDVLVAAARFTQRHSCHVAEYASQGIAFTRGHFLPLQSELERQGRAYVPISLELDGVAVLTGPNMGGKSIGLRTCGFIATCAAFGLPVPAQGAKVALFAHIGWLGIGVADDEDAGLLSSYAREVVRLRETLLTQREPALLLIDEFARTTTPDQGRALLLALIARLQQRHICALIATHLSGIAHAAGVAHFAVRGLTSMPKAAADGDLQAALAGLAQLMDYTIERVAGDGERAADAIFLAGLLGMDRSFVESAWHLLGRGESEEP